MQSVKHFLLDKKMTVLMLIAILVFSACTKSEPQAEDTSIVGKWKIDSMKLNSYKGSKLINSETSIRPDYFLIFNEDGTYQEIDRGDIDMEGTYSFTPGKSKFTFSANGYTGEATISTLNKNKFIFSAINPDPVIEEADKEELITYLSR